MYRPSQDEGQGTQQSGSPPLVRLPNQTAMSKGTWQGKPFTGVQQSEGAVFPGTKMDATAQNNTSNDDEKGIEVNEYTIQSPNYTHTQL